jgi:AcrR family transcriptional regulator
MATMPPRRPKRDELRPRTLAAARAILEHEGLRALTARRIADACGYSVGTLYNLFATTDALIAELNLGTMAELEQALAANPPPRTAAPERAILHVARTALDFIDRNRGRWSAVLEFVPAMPHPRHAETATTADRLIGHLEAALGDLGTRLAGPERRVAAAVLWASFEGILALTAKNNLGMIARADAWTMIRVMVRNFLMGLAAGRGPDDQSDAAPTLKRDAPRRRRRSEGVGTA